MYLKWVVTQSQAFTVLNKVQPFLEIVYMCVGVRLGVTLQMIQRQHLI